MAPMVISLNTLSWNFSEISGRFCYNCPAKTYPTSNIWHMANHDFSVPVFKILERFDQSDFRLNASQSKNAKVMLRKLCKNTKCNVKMANYPRNFKMMSIKFCLYAVFLGERSEVFSDKDTSRDCVSFLVCGIPLRFISSNLIFSQFFLGFSSFLDRHNAGSRSIMSQFFGSDFFGEKTAVVFTFWKFLTAKDTYLSSGHSVSSKMPMFMH